MSWEHTVHIGTFVGSKIFDAHDGTNTGSLAKLLLDAMLNARDMRMPGTRSKHAHTRADARLTKAPFQLAACFTQPPATAIAVTALNICSVMAARPPQGVHVHMRIFFSSLTSVCGTTSPRSSQWKHTHASQRRHGSPLAQDQAAASQRSPRNPWLTHQLTARVAMHPSS